MRPCYHEWLMLFHSGNCSYCRVMSRAMYLIRRVITTSVPQGFWAWLWSIPRRNQRYKQRLICSCETAAPKKCNRNTCRSMADICGWCRQSYPKKKLYQDSWKGFFPPNIVCFQYHCPVEDKIKKKQSTCMCVCVYLHFSSFSVRCCYFNIGRVLHFVKTT